MKSTTMRGLLLGMLLLFIDGVHAQVACPPGEVPYGTGTNDSVCGPDDSEQESTKPQPPPQKWVDHWGAIATFEPNGSLGTATNMTSQSSAEQAALADCQAKHGSTCKVQLSYRNQCAAMVVGGKFFYVNPGPTVAEATQKGMALCNTDATDCHVYYSACSLPQRTQ